jgi:pilus assembly protein Flp/PilA
MPSLIARLRRDERGASATEYAMLICFIALVVAVGAQTFGNSLKTWFNTTAASITGLPTSIPAPQ